MASLMQKDAARVYDNAVWQFAGSVSLNASGGIISQSIKGWTVSVGGSAGQYVLTSVGGKWNSTLYSVAHITYPAGGAKTTLSPKLVSDLLTTSTPTLTFELNDVSNTPTALTVACTMQFMIWVKNSGV
jgi:hypothetical protein